MLFISCLVLARSACCGSTPWRASDFRRARMFDLILGAGVAVFIFAYLVFALLNPEKL